jgi:hypothetical protein
MCDISPSAKATGNGCQREGKGLVNELKVLACHNWGVSKGEDGLANCLLQLRLPKLVLGWREICLRCDGARLMSKRAGRRGEALACLAFLGRLHERLDRWFPLILGGL